MTRVLLAMLILFLLVPVNAAVAQENQQLNDFMRAKLKHSERILDALVREDYDAMAKGGQELSLLSLAAMWQVFKTAEYDKHSQEFRRAADSLAAAAKKKDIDRAAEAYVKVTLSCVNCHKYVRRTRMANLPAPARHEIANFSADVGR